MNKLNIFTLLVLLTLSTSAWAGDSTGISSASKTPKSPILWKTDVLKNVYVVPPNVISYYVGKECPAGSKPTFSVAVSEGFITSSGSSDDKGIRGIHLKAKDISKNQNHELFLSFSEAYVDTIGQADRSINVTYWIYCGS